MAKVMTQDQWLRLACGNDEYRLNLHAPWSDGTYMIATDGHRMHYVETKVPAYPPGEYPDAAMVLRDRPDYLSATIVTEPDTVKKLRAIAKVAIAFGSTKPVLALLTVSNGRMTVTVSDDNQENVFRGDICAGEPVNGTGWKVWVNPEYIADAIDGSFGLVEIRQKEETSGIFLTRGECHACVMPIRAPDSEKRRIAKVAKDLHTEIRS